MHEFLIQGGLGGAEHPPARYKVEGNLVSFLGGLRNPPKEVLQEFFKATGTNLETLTKGRWQEYLKDHFEFEHWSDFDLSPNKIPEVKDIIKSLKDSDLMHLVPGSGEDRFELIAKKWASYIEIFDENKKYMKGFKTILRPKR